MTDIDRRATQRAAAIGGLGIAAALSLRALFRPRPNDTDSRLLDWEAVQHAGYNRSHEHGLTFSSTQLDEECDAHAHTVAPWLAEVCTDAPIAFPNFRAIDRRSFIDQNIRIVQRMVAPVEDLRATIGQSRIAAAGRVVSSRYVGELLGLMSRRVLGQYDPVLNLAEIGDDAPALYIVQPNIAGYAKRFNIDQPSLRRWIIMHELTHAWQFEQHPWLHEYLEAMMRELLMSDLVKKVAEKDGHAGKDLAADMPAAFRRQMAGIGKIQAVMSLLEGYSNFAMNQVGAAHLKNFDELEQSFHQRRSQKSVFERLVLALTGINMKLRQYVIGEKFCKQVVAASDIEHLNAVWRDQTMLPTMSELKDPKQWLKRTAD